MKKVLIACDKFKGSLTAKEVCHTIGTSFQNLDPSIQYSLLPMADGGDGTLAILKEKFSLRNVRKETIDPIGRIIPARYAVSNTTAYIELAVASGIVHLQPSEYDILGATTRGTGILIREAIIKGFQHIVLSIGGSSTNDMGLGIAYELGFQFRDLNDQELTPCGQNLTDIHQIISPPGFEELQFTILCDVTNHLYGPNGAARVFGNQKGATANDITHLDKGMKHIAELILEMNGKDIANFEGSGAAGGIAAGLFGLLPNVHIKSGIQYLSECLSLPAAIKDADLIISGEGKVDLQSFQGKVVGKIYELCTQYNKPLVLIVGINDLEDSTPYIVEGIYALSDIAKSEQESIQNPFMYLEKICHTIYHELAILRDKTKT